MTLRPLILKRLVPSSAPYYLPSTPLARHFQPRFTPRNSQSRFATRRASRAPACYAYRAYHCEQKPATVSCKQSASGLWTAAIVVGVAIGGALLVPLVKDTTVKPKKDIVLPQCDVADFTDSYLVMAPNTPAGRPGTLTADEEEKLRQLWAVSIKVFGVETAAEETNGVETPAMTNSSEASDKDGKKEKKKSRLNVFKRNKGDKGDKSDKGDGDSTHASGARTSTDINSISISPEDDKFGQNQEYKAAIANTPPEELRRSFWSMVKHDHPDALLLRFLRARKWDVEKALVMMISTMHWRLKEMHVDDDIMMNGELGAVEQTRSSDTKVKKNAEDFLTQLRMGKSYLHGLDNEGRPMCFVRARLHKAGDQTEESLERFTVFTIETARMTLRPPVDTATVVFDLTDFSMANMDYAPVKFMIKCFEANYPESLGTVLVYKAPWVFNAVWSIVRGWLDPVVASKVHFVKNVEELQKFVPRSQIPADCGGDEKWEYVYSEPVPGENDRMKDEATKQALLEQRKSIVERYETIVLDWVHAGREEHGADKRRQERDAVAEELRKNYWQVDPYVRARSLYDRMGVIGEGGKLDFYPQANQGNVKPGVDTSADDVD